MKRSCILSSLLLLILAAGVAAADDGDAAEALSAQAAFDRLKTLEGTWHGTASGHDGEGGGEVTHVFRNSAAGTVVMETMNPGVENHEMINMYHLDGDDLVLTHYCAGNNQPTMRLASASGEEMRFDFTGGTNLDPEKDPHIHGAKLVLVDADTLESSWTGYNEGKEAGVQVFTLKRGQ